MARAREIGAMTVDESDEHRAIGIELLGTMWSF
jgi:hypothetical protein